jgi:ribosome modulation factor
MTKRDQLERVIAHSRAYHKGEFFILGLRRGYQGGYSSPDTTSAKASPVYETVEEVLQRMTQAPCTCIVSDIGGDGEILG